MRRAVVSITRAEGAVEEVQASLDGLAAHHAVPPDALCDMQIALDDWVECRVERAGVFRARRKEEDDQQAEQDSKRSGGTGVDVWNAS